MSLSKDQITTIIERYIEYINELKQNEDDEICWNAGIVPTKENWGLTMTRCIGDNPYDNATEDDICTSNYFGNGWQCNGFARFIGYLLTGTQIYQTGFADEPNNYGGGWTKYTDLTNYEFCPGDIVEIHDNKNYHSAIVVSANDDNVSFFEAWGGEGCKIADGVFNGGAFYDPNEINYVKISTTATNLRLYANHVIKCPPIEEGTPAPKPDKYIVNTRFYQNHSDDDNTVHTGTHYEYVLSEKFGSFPAVPTREEYNFAGWFTDRTGGTPVTTDSVVSWDKNNLYAQWTEDVEKVPVTFKKNINADGGPDVATVEYVVGEKYGSFPSSGTREGYDFEGWYTSTRADAGEYSTDSIVRADRKEIWARWSYPVTMYYCNDSGGYSKKTAIDKLPYGTDFLAAPPDGTMPTNYRFDGWYTAESGGTKIESTDIPEGQTELYAHWIETVYVKFMQNTETNGDPVAHEGTYDVGSTYGALPDPNARDEQYSFLGWYTSQNSGDKYYHWSPVKSYRTQIWAHWKYDIELYMNEGDATPVATVSAQTGNTYGSLVSAGMYTKYGYEHTGWAYDEERTNVCNLNDYVDNKTNKLYAIWEAKKMKVTYNYGIDGVNDTVYNNVEFGNKYGTNVPGISVVHELGKAKNMEFAGWYLPEVSSDSDVKMDTDHTIYAMWEPHKVSFSAGYSEFTDAVPDITVKQGETYGVLPTPRSTDMYKFSYWTYESGDEYVVCDAGTELAVAADHTLTANWETRRFARFIYENENGEETTKSCSQMFGSAYENIPELVEKVGYDVKWIFSEEGSPYDGTQFFPGMLAIPEHPNTIKAVYTAKDIPITYDMCGGVWLYMGNEYEICENVLYEFNKWYGLWIIPEREGYKFTGWYYDEACTQLIGSDDVITNPEPHTVYAGWKKNITLTFDPGDSTFAETVDSKIVYAGESYGELPVPKSADNYKFSGWVTVDENEEVGDFVSADTLVTTNSNHTLMAVWTTVGVLTLDPVGGTVIRNIVSITYGNNYPRLPSASFDGYTFVGWFFGDDTPYAGVQCTTSLTVLPEHPDTVYAKWTQAEVNN